MPAVTGTTWVDIFPAGCRMMQLIPCRHLIMTFVLIIIENSLLAVVLLLHQEMSVCMCVPNTPPVN
jgi:hypothetical protein